MSTFRQHLDATRYVIDGRPHSIGSRWSLWGLRLPLRVRYPLWLLVPAGAHRRVRESAELGAFRREVLGVEPEWLATPTVAELRDLAGDGDVRAYRSGDGDRRLWSIGSATFDARLIAIGLSLLPEVPRVVIDHRAPSTTAMSALCLSTPNAEVVIAPFLGTPKVRLRERRGRLVLQEIGSLARAS